MAVAEKRTCMIIRTIITISVFIPKVVGQGHCNNETLNATGIYKYFYSPNYPNIYLSNTDYQWRIEAASTAQEVLLYVVDFYTEGTSPSCINDYVAIYDGSNTSSQRTQKLCGQFSSSKFASSGSNMTVVFHSNGNDNYRGFKFGYISQNKSAVPAQCNDSNLKATESPGTLTSPNFPSNYSSNTNCEWHITAASPSKVIGLTLLNFSVEGTPPVCNDYVAFFDGPDTDSTVLRTLCNPSSIKKFTSNGPSMTIVFHSDDSNSYPGFKFEYISQDKPASCSPGTIQASSNASYLTSPNYPDPYPRNIYCQWYIISGNSSSVVVLELTQFSLEGNPSNCSSDYVKIYDGPTTDSRLMRALCGNVTSEKFVSTSSAMVVAFQSNEINSIYKGFSFTILSQESQDNENSTSGNNTSTITISTSTDTSTSTISTSTDTSTRTISTSTSTSTSTISTSTDTNNTSTDKTSNSGRNNAPAVGSSLDRTFVFVVTALCAWIIQNHGLEGNAEILC